MTAGTRAKARDYEVSKHLWGLLPNESSDAKFATVGAVYGAVKKLE